MASLDRRLNPLYAIKECSSCGTLYTGDCGCSKGGLEDKILTLEEVFQDFQDTSKSSDDDTNFVNQEPFVVKQARMELLTRCTLILKILSSLSLHLYPVEDSDSLIEEINIFLDDDDSIPPGIESDDFDSEDDDNSTFLPEFESFHVDNPECREIQPYDVVEDIPPLIANILPTHPALQLDFNSCPSNDLVSDLEVLQSPSWRSFQAVSSEKPDVDSWRQHSKFGCSSSPFLSPLTSSSMGDRVKLSDLKQALRGGTPYVPGFEATCASQFFVLRSQELHILTSFWECKYPNLSTNVYLSIIHNAKALV
ncbi:hypothetical protein Tco_0387073 [Tanacetum coccineum]